MQLIPVIDLLNGCVVRASRGQRDKYRPIESQLCVGSAPRIVARSLVDYCGARVVYVADLNALLTREPQFKLIAELVDALPGIELWLDAGFSTEADISMLLKVLGTHAASVTPVIGT